MDPDDENTGVANDENSTPDVSAFEAKIAELTAAVAARDAQLLEAANALTAAKAANYDLLVASGAQADDVVELGEDDAPDIDDFFD